LNVADDLLWMLGGMCEDMDLGGMTRGIGDDPAGHNLGKAGNLSLDRLDIEMCDPVFGHQDHPRSPGATKDTKVFEPPGGCPAGPPRPNALRSGGPTRN
jgi:hypothetical protein